MDRCISLYLSSSLRSSPCRQCCIGAYICACVQICECLCVCVSFCVCVDFVSISRNLYLECDKVFCLSISFSILKEVENRIYRISLVRTSQQHLAEDKNKNDKKNHCLSPISSSSSSSLFAPLTKSRCRRLLRSRSPRRPILVVARQQQLLLDGDS